MKFEQILKETKSKQEIMSDKIKDYNIGKLYIDFMLDKDKIKLCVKFDNKISWLLNKNKEKVMYFNSTQDFKSHITSSIDNYYGSDLEKVHKYIFDPKNMDNIFQQIREYAKEYPNKAKSLTYNSSQAAKKEKKSNWDMEVIFRKSVENYLKNGKTLIIPSITGNDQFGKIVEPEEIEIKPKKSIFRSN